MKKYRGKDLLVWVRAEGSDDMTPIVCSTSCTIDISCDLAEIAPRTARAKEYKPGRYSWQVSSESMVPIDNTFQREALVAALKSGKRFALSWGAGVPPADGGPWRGYSGFAYVASVNDGAPLGSMETLRVSFQGTGELDIEPIE